MYPIPAVQYKSDTGVAHGQLPTISFYMYNIEMHTLKNVIHMFYVSASVSSHYTC